MSGIAGIFNLDGRPVPHKQIKAMTDAMAYRGPDGASHYVDRNIALGCLHTDIHHLAFVEHEPLISVDGNTVVAVDGELYNHQELSRELIENGHNLRTHNPNEIIIHGYIHYGISLVEKLNGMFGFVLWDAKKRILYLVRDRFGCKPLYWWSDGSTLLFASEIKAILTHPHVSVELNYDALNEYFTFQNLLRYHTLFQGVNLVQAASVRWIDETDRTLHHRCYWDYNFTDRDNSISEKEAQEEILRLLRQAVRRQTYPELPVGVGLSGGLDSSSLCALASEVKEHLYTFTCGFQMNGVGGKEVNCDERQGAEQVAAHFRTEHYEQVMGARDIRWVLPELVYHLEDLRVGMSYPNYYISRLASKYVTILLNGAGGDELFGGYSWRYYRIFRSVTKEEYLRRYYDYWQRLVPDEDKPELFTQDTWANVGVRDMRDVFRRVCTFNENLRYDSPEEHIANAMYFEIKTFLQALFIVEDKIASAHGLEERACFMDNDLVDFAQKLPIHLKLVNLKEMIRMDENELKKLQKYYQRYNAGKSILRKAMSSLLPKEITQGFKQGFSAPDESWYRGANVDYVKDTLLAKRAAYRDFIQPSYVGKIIDEHCNKRINHRLLIWSLLCFEHWVRIFMDRKY